ncbi:MAG: 7-carboxy-7-deazaguanine synthase QueE [Oscillatoriales cyanobacterium SM2_2_1]|nr:7-carboxy-7-deazaguanine synthase QueE [Oscillatoriales cyanobacterium SM2_2_1]
MAHPMRNPHATYPIVETFHSIQGEGTWAGTSAWFVRLAGCDVHCPWCDTKESWSALRHPQRVVDDLTAEAVATGAAIAIVTGGEPLMHDLSDLTEVLQHHGLPVHLETSGAHPLTGTFSWITLSPKTYRPPHPAIYDHASELKVVIATPEDFAWAERQAAQVPPSVPRYLQPEWHGGVALQQQVIAHILRHPQWRLSLQTHKLLGVR